MRIKKFAFGAAALAMALSSTAPVFAEEAPVTEPIVEETPAPAVIDVTPAPSAEAVAEIAQVENDVPAVEDAPAAEENPAADEEVPAADKEAAVDTKTTEETAPAPAAEETTDETETPVTEVEADKQQEEVDKLAEENTLFTNAKEGEEGNKEALLAAQQQAEQLLKEQGYVIPDGASVVVMGTGEGWNYADQDEPRFQLSHDGSSYDVTTLPGGEYKAGQPIILILEKYGTLYDADPDKVEYLVYQGIVEDQDGKLVVKHPVWADQDPSVAGTGGRDLLYRATFVRVVKKEEDGTERILLLEKDLASSVTEEKKSPNTSVH